MGIEDGFETILKDEFSVVSDVGCDCDCYDCDYNCEECDGQ